MKQLLLFLCSIVLCACSESIETASPESAEVRLSFSPYQQESMTRSITSISSVATHLDVWISDGSTTQDVHQSNTDSNFGSITVKLDKTKTYTLTAVAHRCASDASLVDGVIAFPDEKVTHSMIYTTTFSPATSTDLSCIMQRIVGQFRLEVTDAIPDEVYTMTFAFGSTFTRWNVASAIGTNAIERTARFENFTHSTPTVFNLYIIPTNLTDSYVMNIEVNAYTSNNMVIKSRTFADVPVRAGYKTTYHGEFFTDRSVNATFTVNDWNEYDVVNF